MEVESAVYKSLMLRKGDQDIKGKVTVKAGRVEDLLTAILLSSIKT